MLDLDDVPVGPLARGLLLIVRIVWWLAWEICLVTVGWFVGWPICRALTLGRLPGAHITECDDVACWLQVAVALVGLGTLAGLLFLLPGYAG
ncbi:hypothetical protein [Tahibacter amnicola]|uniref:Uncharacterized protein n=1 Tax=Tahibacter amnicola TaxID=2976241 RepID=A0ABY6BM93_9GAMM|nr:hypothetical protein [Tahibacter amnicola]UXI70175.1 hypothetical protein N4264_11245 [Tahibacter amnicola]